jgi:hypothetical protein
MAALIELREHTAGTLDFDRVARTRGASVLREWWGNNISASMGFWQAFGLTHTIALLSR